MTSNHRNVLSSTLESITNHFKPHHAEALQRIRLNGMCIVTALVLSYLLPCPSVFKALRVAMESDHYAPWSSQWYYKWFCIFELVTLSILTFNLFEAAFALKYPRTPLPPISSPAKVKSLHSSPVAQKRPFKILSPKSSPQPQRPFAFSPSASFSLSSSTSTALAYPATPASSPSKVLHYSNLPGSLTTSASSPSFMSTPSPVISAYRGKYSNRDVGRALDGSYLGLLATEDEDD